MPDGIPERCRPVWPNFVAASCLDLDPKHSPPQVAVAERRTVRRIGVSPGCEKHTRVKLSGS
jgi:hypothetical protein